MKGKLKGSAVAAVVIALAMSVAACGSSSSGSSGGSGSSAGSGSTSSSGGNKAAIPVGQVGAYSGPVPGLSGEGQGFQAWVKMTNAAGGIDGHKITLYTADSQGNPTNEVSATSQMMTQHHVVAFGGMGLTTVAGIAKLTYAQHIPVVGGNTNDLAFATSPGYYTPGTNLLGTYLGGFFGVPKGKTKTGLIYCSESAGCTGVYDLMFKEGLSKLNGGDPVYAAKTSLASPSFTSQCLAAKQAGVQTLAVAFDTTNMIRLAKNCNQQGFNPAYAIGGTVAATSVATSGVTNGSVSGQAQAPWFLTSGPIGQMKSAMAKYLPKDTIDSTTVEGWAAGVALGQGIKNYYQAHTSANTLTGQDIMDGLGMIKNDTFGGLTPPVTFTSSGVQPATNCYFSIKVANNKWVEAGTAPICPSATVNAGLSKALKALAG